MNNIDCIVSLTSWKGRINNPEVPKVLFSIIRQKTKYRFKVCLTLSLVEFPNKNDDLPEILNLLEENKSIEIIWAPGNLKALKKLYPVIDIYPDIPILTTDDDIILADNAVETFMDIYKEKPNTILTELGWKMGIPGMVCTGSFRLFPPNSLYKLPPTYFIKYFKCCEDDPYLALLAKLNHTDTIILKRRICQEIKTQELNKTALKNEYRKCPWRKCYNALVTALKSEGIM